MKKILLILLFVLNTQVWGQTDICQFNNFVLNRAKIQTGQFRDGDCFVSISDTKTASLIYRSHLFTDQGLQMVFNSYGYGPTETHTGARIFFHPAQQKSLDLRIQGNTLELQLANGNRIYFDTVQYRFSQLSDIKYLEDISVNRNNQGGIVINSSPTAYFDFGFRLGGSPLLNLDGSFLYIVPGRPYCQLRNNLVLRRVQTDVEWRYSPYGELENFVRGRCGI